ncbi:MAG: NAD-dependent epimerase/dehydratase family protein [Pseudomonadota bacterium]
MTTPLIVLGAGGKLGTLLSGIWPTDVVQYRRADLDILDDARLTAALRRAAAVLCLAGVTHDADRPMSLNTTLAQLTLDAAARAQSGRVFLMSSAAVYGAQDGPLSEDTAPMPRSDYARAKLEMEAMALAHAHPNTVLRLGNVAGADTILGGWHDMFTLDTLPDGTTPRRSYVGPGALVRVLMELAGASDLPNVLNVAAPVSVQMGALLDAAGLVWAPRAATPDTIPEVTLDTSALAAFADFDPQDQTPAGIVADWRAAP